MGKHKKEKKSKKDKKKDHKKKKNRSRSPSSSSRSSRTNSSSRSSSPNVKSSSSKKTETLDDLFKKSQASDINWHLNQKSETLLYEQFKDPSDKQTETFIWRKKNQKIGLDKLEPEKFMLINKLKQDETRVNFLKEFR